MLEHGFVAAFGQAGQSDRGVQAGTLGDGPATFAGPAPSIGVVLVNSLADQVLPFPFGLLPVLPDAVPQAVAHLPNEPVGNPDRFPSPPTHLPNRCFGYAR